MIPQREKTKVSKHIKNKYMMCQDSSRQRHSEIANSFKVSRLFSSKDSNEQESSCKHVLSVSQRKNILSDQMSWG